MDIKNRKVEELIPYVNNPRDNSAAVDAVASSIAEFGFKVPIIVDRNSVVVTGHTRLQAAKKLGLAEVPVLMADDLSDAQVKAFRIADNKVSSQAGTRNCWKRNSRPSRTPEELTWVSSASQRMSWTPSMM